MKTLKITRKGNKLSTIYLIHNCTSQKYLRFSLKEGEDSFKGSYKLLIKINETRHKKMKTHTLHIDYKH